MFFSFIAEPEYFAPTVAYDNAEADAFLVNALINLGQRDQLVFKLLFQIETYLTFIDYCGLR